MNRYECDQCGACCTCFAVPVEEEDAWREPAIRRLFPLPIQKDEGWLNWTREDGTTACQFLENHGTCSIQMTKPMCCSRFKPGDSMCQFARGRAGLGFLYPVEDAK